MRANLMFKAIFLIALPIFGFTAKAPDFTVTDYNNKVHKLYEAYLDKDKVMVIKFFFVGCPPCTSIAPYVQQSYARWGSGAGKVEFLQISTMKGDYNSTIKSYSQNKGLTFPGVGVDGGAQAALAPYLAGTFGSWYGTPTFVVIAPNGEVNYNVNMSLGNPSGLDTAIAQALRLGNGGGGGGGCTNAFTVNTITKILPETYYIVDLLNGNPASEIQTGNYNCEFQLPQNIDGHYVIPQMNQTIDPRQNVSTADIVLIQRYILTLQPFNNLQRAVADVNNSGSITAADVSEIRKLILGITAGFNKLTKSYVVVHNPKSLNYFDLTDRVLVKDLVSKAKTNVFGVGQYGDVGGANLISNDDLIVRSSGKINFFVEVTQNSNGNFEHRFYSDETLLVNSFQYEIQGTENNILDVMAGNYFSSNLGFKYSLNNAPGTARMVGLASNLAANIPAGETWFTVITKDHDKFKNSHVNGFNYEFALDNLSRFISDVNLIYLVSSLKGQNVSIYYSQLNDIIINSTKNAITKIDCLNLNGNQVFNYSYPAETYELEIKTTSMQPGIYFAKVQLANGNTELKKFVKF